MAWRFRTLYIDLKSPMNWEHYHSLQGSPEIFQHSSQATDIMHYLKLIPCLLLGTLAQAILLPTPPGKANVHVTHYPLTDTSRVDPFAPGGDQPRRLMLTLYQPATCDKTEPITYIQPTSAAAIQKVFGPYLPNISFDNFQLQVCPEAQVNDETPLLIFSPGYWAPRVVYATILQWVAALGFNVLSIDHPYDATIVEYPDGSYVDYANVTIPDDILLLLAPRVADGHLRTLSGRRHSIWRSNRGATTSGLLQHRRRSMGTRDQHVQQPALSLHYRSGPSDLRPIWDPELALPARTQVALGHCWCNTQRSDRLSYTVPIARDELDRSRRDEIHWNHSGDSSPDDSKPIYCDFLPWDPGEETRETL
jgi:hypothetical protein